MPIRLLATAALAVAGLLILRRFSWPPSSLAYAFAALALFWASCAVVLGRWNPFSLVLGEDNRVSTSKFQHFVWTGVVLFTYVLLSAERFRTGYLRVVDNIPANVLLAMGFAIATSATAKAIVVSYVRSGELTKTDKPDGQSSVAGLVATDAGVPDLAKIQMLVFTVIAAVTYLVIVFHRYKAFARCGEFETGPACDFPDIDGTLMVLMGLSQGAYIGNKLTQKDTPWLGRLEPTAGARGARVTLRGASLGGGDGSWLTLNGTPIPCGEWKDDAVTFDIPRRRPGDGTPWRFGDIMQVEVVSNGRRGANTIPFQVVAPVLRGISAASPKPGQGVELTGENFGPAQEDSEILFDGRPIPGRATSWTDGRIQFVVPTQHPNGTPWPASPAVRDVQVQLRIDGQDAPSTLRISV